MNYDFPVVYDAIHIQLACSKRTLAPCRKYHYPFDAPTKGASKKCILVAQNIDTLQDLVAVDDREPAVTLSPEHIIIHHLFQAA